MKRILRPVYALLMSALCCSSNEKAELSSVDAAEFAKVIADSTVVLLDVRTAEEHAAACI